MDAITIFVLVAVFTALCVYAWMRAAAITDQQDERTAQRLHMQNQMWRWPERDEA